ncbi:MAG: EF-hand domain-containing protein [Sedimenticola sp.]|nr:EF-hand domain-containing protein [Sedimenticola sp.]
MNMKWTPIQPRAWLMLLLLAAPLTAAGQATEPTATGNGASRPFSIHDLDRDGRLSHEEYRQFLAHTEQRRQAAEQAGRPGRPPLQFHEIDSNSDDYLDEDEMISALNRRLERHRQRRNRGGRW